MIVKRQQQLTLLKTPQTIKAITKAVIKFVEESSFHLQETLAENIAELVKRDFGVESIKLRVSKPGALRGAEDVGLIIHR